MKQEARHLFQFGAFRLDEAEKLLTRAGKPVHLPPKAFDSLLVLVRQHGQLISKQQLMEEVWPETFVEEANLAQQISVLRRALLDEDGQSHLIETVPRF